MKLDDLRTEIPGRIGTDAAEARSETAVHEALVAAGRSVSTEEVRKVCVSLVIGGRSTSSGGC